MPKPRVVMHTYRMRDIEARYPGLGIKTILELLYKEHGSINAVGRALGIPPSTVYRWMKKLGIETPMWEPERAGSS